MAQTNLPRPRNAFLRARIRSCRAWLCSLVILINGFCVNDDGA